MKNNSATFKLKKAINLLRLEIDASIVDNIERLLLKHDRQLINRERNRSIRIYSTLLRQGFPVSEAEFSIAIDSPKLIPLTKKQKEIMDYISELDIINMKKVANYFNCSINNISGHFNLLKEKGYLRNDKNKKPAWIVINKNENS